MARTGVQPKPAQNVGAIGTDFHANSAYSGTVPFTGIWRGDGSLAAEIGKTPSFATPGDATASLTIPLP
jgi:hypothetical protein